ncbi:MAG: nodulation protein NfeD [Chloroflexi bacterium]|jgi:membrane-bound serine protease (ClpP class)|nr:nodulation protein NfeD [Chloroflexota bacterium]MBT7081203.1 nodulation protein NfeD [Chloroflexota bacterium]MBT7290258.1 nodulation protein NfeD [Chloroflexota bacterium]
MRHFVVLVIICLAITSNVLAITKAGATAQSIETLEIKGAIVPVTADYINRGITIAEQNDSIVIILMDTPGGLGTAMEEICQRIGRSEVPVIVYVEPEGWAASAGTFITMAAHVAAMAPSSAIGAATPISGEGEELPETVKRKAINFYEAYIAALAKDRGHNVEWAKQAVREAASADGETALANNVIDILADDYQDLLNQLNGFTVNLTGDRQVTLDTDGSVTTAIPMNLAERFLLAISDSNVAYILLGLAMLGIFLELSNPGTIFPGVIGGILLLLALYSLSMLSAEWSGILLMVLACVLFLLETFVTSGGLLVAGGIASLIMGSMVLFSDHPAVFQINPWLIAGVAIIVSIFFVFVVSAIIRGHRRQPATGAEGLVNMLAVAKTDLNPAGVVFLHGENWNATSEGGKISHGDEVKITEVAGLKLKVKKSK